MQKEKLQRDTGSVLWGSQRFPTYEKEVNKWIWEGVWGSWTQGIGTPGPELKGLTQTPSDKGRPSRRGRRRRKCLSICCPQVGSSWHRVHFSSSRLHRTDHCPLRSTRSPPRAGCSSQTCGVCSGGTCGACGGSGSSPHTQSCSSPRSWSHSRRRLEGTSGDILGGI